MRHLYPARKKRKSVGYIVVLILIGLLFLGIFYGANYAWQIIAASRITTYVSRAEKFDINNRMNLLLLAVDAPTLQEASRCDTIKLFSIEPKKPSITIMTIPRDSWVSPAGFPETKTKINAINNQMVSVHYGTPKLIETIEELLGIKIHGYVKINYNGFINVVDTIGGIDMNVEKPMHYVDTVDGYQIHIDKGFQHLDGERALQYVRFRSDANADYAYWDGKVLGRSARQTEFIKALLNEMAKPSSWSKIPDAITATMQNVETDIPMSEIFSFVEILRRVGTGSINEIPFPATPDEVYDAWLDQMISILNVNRYELSLLVQQHFIDHDETPPLVENLETTPDEDSSPEGEQ
ncbi:MAG TPA: LCP family protein [Caldisericia bacterium]|nr:LCP family protein [Caldisericia bacterium]HPF49152.1 LCP family protein [Caldisericia bacterium]HPI82984.1 LCP family protein [Caldisericia bacterium]HPQ92211.1 LCP family protein [Caldisericia bacterium]HRV74691.1 LCP family protein [Caldisericia bacterium]